MTASSVSRNQRRYVRLLNDAMKLSSRFRKREIIVLLAHFVSCQQIRSLIIPPLSFHGQSSSNRLRRNRRVSSSTSTNALGQEIMIVRFWVEGTPPKDDRETNWMDTLKKWIGPIIFEDSYRPGSYVPTPSIKPNPAPPPPPPPPRTWSGWVGDGLAAVFGSLIPTTTKDGKKTGGEAVTPANMFKKPRRPKAGEYWTGEATAELRKVSRHLSDTFY